MDFKSQIEPLSQLKDLSVSNRHSILIEGPAGCGKTYLARQYANMLGISDIIEVAPKVSELRDAINQCMNVDNNLLVCIENLDNGVAAAAYSVLKFLEEPMPNVYIVVTCRNLRGVPDTIISRSTVVTVCPPAPSDIASYGAITHPEAYNRVKDSLVWSCVRTLADADSVLKMDDQQIQYYSDLAKVCKFKDSVSNIVWAISHYSHNNAECNIELAIRSIAAILNTPFVIKCSVDCVRELGQKRIAQHAVLSKFVFNIKYCE